MQLRTFEQYGICSVDEFMANNNRMPAAYIRELQDEHNVNLHSDGSGDEYLDAADDETADLEIVDEEEFIERFTESGHAEQLLAHLGYQL
jgi:hypothetical protein